MAIYASQEWLTLVQEKLNASKEYEEAAKDWEGDFYIIVEKGGAIKESIYMYMDMWHGKCRKAVIAKDPNEFKPEYTMAATMETWRKGMEGKADSIQLMATRQLKIKGNMAKVARNVKATMAMTAAINSIKTEFPV